MIPNLGGDVVPWALFLLACSRIDDADFDARVDSDGDGVTVDLDCDDADAAVGAPVPWWPDGDGDGYGVDPSRQSCRPSAGYAPAPGDCDDANLAVHPHAVEVCNNHVDDDCDGGAPACALSGEIGVDTEVVFLFGEHQNDRLGYAIALADIDDDGIDDWLIGAPDAASGAGAAMATRGGIDATTSVADPDVLLASVSGALASDRAGVSVAPASNLIGDGGAWAVGVDIGDGDEVDSGVVAILEGQLGGSVGSNTVDLLGERTGDRAGSSLAGGADLDGDGTADLVVGAPGRREADGAIGIVYLIRGPVLEDQSLATSTATFHDPSLPPGLGSVVANVGDVDGDGVADVAAGGVGRVCVWSGDLEGAQTLEAATATLTFDGEFGAAIAGGADLSADGLADFVVGAPEDERGATRGGAAAVVVGDPNGALEIRTTWLSSESGAGAGMSVSLAGDQDGDGIVDLLVGGPGYDTADGGRVWLLPGSAEGTRTLDEALARFGGRPDIYLGYSVAGGSDLDADGYPDLLLGAPWDDSVNANAGAVYLVRGLGP